MSIQEIYYQFIDGMKETSWLEYIGVFCGIGSVWFSKKENILVYPVGLVNTILYIYISIKGKLFGEASVNFYYTVMSIYGWILWSKKDKIKHEIVLHISYSNKKEWIQQLSFFGVFYVAIYFSLTWLKNNFAPGAIPWADAFASATAYTGMWLMAKKKIESWIWWIATNCASIPLYFIKGYVFTSVQFLVLLILAVAGLMEWIDKRKQLNRI
ncbi:nicotinamide riboside transporter PnuC [mine drainage metagenome]|uniref:Nicotinamide riboside transporter PnuC n=1 Tax=mine drainage metagenome TaxID=410659 RepID=A0A1J5SAK5_9ZZZZ